jgi:hypothetical protein
MGWASGSRLFSSVIESVKEEVVSSSARDRIYRPIIEAFLDADWDTMDECLGEDPVYDAIYNEMWPEE